MLVCSWGVCTPSPSLSALSACLSLPSVGVLGSFAAEELQNNRFTLLINRYVQKAAFYEDIRILLDFF